MSTPKVAVMTFGDERPDMWEKVFGPLTIPRHKQAIEYFKNLGLEVYTFDEIARTKEQIDSQVDELQGKGVEVMIAHIPCWTSPNLVVRGVQRMNLPTIALTNKHAGTHGGVGFFGASGTLTQIGFPHRRVREDFDSPELESKVLPFIRAASAKAKLQGKMFGLFGGRSLGIDTGTFDPMQWRRQFGVDVEHIDQLEIIRRAEMIEAERTQNMVTWLADNTACICYDDNALTDEKLAFAVNCYLATKDIIAEKGLDFVAIKCMPDLVNHYIPQCISAAFLPGPYDADGDKEPVSMACEADGDGALTMEMLKDISGGGSLLFGDVSHINDATNTLYIPNCGSQCTWFAGRSGNPAENLKQVEIRPSVRPAGGATVYFTAAPGPVTLARLYRDTGQYKMAIIPGEAIELPQEELDEFINARGKHQLPTMFVKVKMNLEHLVQEFGSNHISGVAGHYVEELVQVCNMLDITPVVMDENF
ncbi:MAG: L-fucose isomerase [bacterium]|nr:L-fucose isomerase [bacterium]